MCNRLGHLTNHVSRLLLTSCLACSILELPQVLPIGDLVSIGLSMLHTGAIYAPGERNACSDVAGLDGLPQIATSKPNRGCDGSPIGTRADVRVPGEDIAPPRCVACQARHASAVYSRRLQTLTVPDVEVDKMEVARCFGGASDADIDDIAEPRTPRHSVSSGQPGVGTSDHERAQRAKMASCWQAMNNLRQETEFFSQDLDQAHFQV